MAFPEDTGYGLPYGSEQQLPFMPVEAPPGLVQGPGLGGGMMGMLGNPLVGAALAGLGNVGRGMANRRMEQNQNQLSQDQQRLGIDQLALQYANFNRQDPEVRASHAVRGDILSGFHPVQGMGSGKDFHITGGFNDPNLISQGTRNYGQLMSAAATGEGPRDPSLLDNPARKAMLEQLRGNYGPRQQKFTQPGQLKKAGLGEKILSFF